MFLYNTLFNKRFFLALNILTLLFASCFLTGCGFAVRSQQSFPSQLHSMYFQADNQYGQFETALKKELRAANISIGENSNKAPLVFHANAVSFYHSSDTSSGPSTQARIYHLTMTTSFYIHDNKGKIVLPNRQITSTRDLTLNSNEIFDTSTQVNVSKQNMRQELIIKIFNILSSNNTFVALKEYSNEK